MIEAKGKDCKVMGKRTTCHFGGRVIIKNSSHGSEIRFLEKDHSKVRFLGEGIYIRRELYAITSVLAKIN